MISDLLRLAIIMPFILQKFLKVTSLKNSKFVAIKIRLNINNNNSILNHIISCWVLIAKTIKVVFSNKFTSNKYKLLQNCLEAELDFLLKVIIYKFTNSNIIINIHVGIKEIVYHIFKGIVQKTNRKNIELDLLKHYTTLFAIQHLMDGNANLRFIRSCAGFSNMLSNFKQLFSNWYIGENKLLQDDDNDQVDVNGKIK